MEQNIKIYTTGGTEKYLTNNNIPCSRVEDITTYPSILDGRVKTLHPKVFGGILFKRNDISDQNEISSYEIPEIDLVIVDLYPFEKTLADMPDNEEEIIEKIDIGGVSLLRAAAKNYQHVTTISNSNQYLELLEVLKNNQNQTNILERRNFATQAFIQTCKYDSAIANWFASKTQTQFLSHSFQKSTTLRYGENPHQSATYFGDLDVCFKQLHGKALSYNNLVDVDAALSLSLDLPKLPTVVIVKHTNSCGVATRYNLSEAWQHALASDPTSAFGGVIAINVEIDKDTAMLMNELFFEVCIAPNFSKAALEILSQKKNRILLKKEENYLPNHKQYKSIFTGLLEQNIDEGQSKVSEWNYVTSKLPDQNQISDLQYAEVIVKHLKSNGIALVKNQTLIGMGCGQTSRVDALNQAILKAKSFGLSVEQTCLASEAFFPFADCVEIAAQNGISSIIQPGGSIKDELSINAANFHGLSMVFSGVRHFKH